MMTEIYIIFWTAMLLFTTLILLFYLKKKHFTLNIPDLESCYYCKCCGFETEDTTEFKEHFKHLGGKTNHQERSE